MRTKFGFAYGFCGCWLWASSESVCKNVKSHDITLWYLVYCLSCWVPYSIPPQKTSQRRALTLLKERGTLCKKTSYLERLTNLSRSWSQRWVVVRWAWTPLLGKPPDFKIYPRSRDAFMWVFGEDQKERGLMRIYWSASVLGIARMALKCSLWFPGIVWLVPEISGGDLRFA